MSNPTTCRQHPGIDTTDLVDDAVPAERWEGRTIAEWRDLWGLDVEPAGHPALPATGHGQALHGPAGGRPLLQIYERACSTNTIARRLAEAGAPAGTTIIADEQTAGRGRSGRTWHAPPGLALLFSILLRPDRPLGPDDSPGAIPLRIGLAVAAAIDRLAGTEIRLKWPNDLVIEGEGKLAGILCEGALNARDGGYIIAGIGINVAQLPADFDPAIAQPSTSLRLATGRLFDRGDLAAAIRSAITAAAPGLVLPLDDDELARLAARDPLHGKRISVDGDPAGTAHGIAPDGSLRILRDDGRIGHLTNGTVRPIPVL